MKEIRTDNVWPTSQEEAASTEMNKDAVTETETLTKRIETAKQAAALRLRTVCTDGSDDDNNFGYAATDIDPRLMQYSNNDSRNTSDTGNSSLSDMYSAPIPSTLEDSNALPMPLLDDSSNFDNNSEDDILDGTRLDIKRLKNFFRNAIEINIGNSSLSSLSDAFSAPVSPSCEETRDSPESQQWQEKDSAVLSTAPEKINDSQVQEHDNCWISATPHQHGRQEREMRDELRGTWSTQEEWDSLFESSKGSVNQVFEKNTPITNKGIEFAVTATDAVTSGASQTAFALDKKYSSEERSDEVYTPWQDYFPLQPSDQRDSAPVESSEFSKHVRVTVVGPETPKKSLDPVYQFVMASSISKNAQTPIRHRRRQRSKASSTQQDLQACISSSEGSQPSVSSVGRFLEMLLSPCSVDQDDEEPVAKMSSIKDHDINNSVRIPDWTGDVDADDRGVASQWQRQGEGNSSGENKRQNADRELPGCPFMRRMISDTLFGNIQNNKVPGDVVSAYRSHDLVRTDKNMHMPPLVIEHESSYDDDASDITDVVWNVTDDETSDTKGYNEREGQRHLPVKATNQNGARQRHLPVKATNQNGDSYNEVLVVKKALESEELSHISNDNDSIVDKAIEEIFRSEEVSIVSGTRSEDDSFDVTTILLLVSQKEERDDSLTRSLTFDYQASDDDDDDDNVGDFGDTPQPNKITSLLDQVVTTFPDEVMDEVTGRLVSSAIVKEKGFNDGVTSAQMMNAVQVTNESMSATDVHRLASSDLDTETDRETRMKKKQDGEEVASSISTEIGEWVAFFDHTALVGKEQQIRIPMPDDAIVSSSLPYQKSESERQGEGFAPVIYQHDGVMVKKSDNNINGMREASVGGRLSSKGHVKPRVAWLLNKIRGGGHNKRIPANPLAASGEFSGGGHIKRVPASFSPPTARWTSQAMLLAPK